jgi:hypothetical protein
MRHSTEVQFIPATGQPEYAVVPYAVYLALKQREEQISVPIVSEPLPPLGVNPIKYWRQTRGFSQSGLAKVAQISVPYLSQLEHNLRVGSKAVLKRLATALQVTIDQIIY